MVRNRWVIFLALWGILSWGGIYVLTFLLIPASKADQETVLEITDGTGLREVARLLKHNGLIANEQLFVLVSKMSGAERRIQKGEYRFEPKISPMKILSVLKSGRVLLHELTIPEGYTFDQVAKLLEERGLGFYNEFKKIGQDPEFLRSLEIPGESVEGYLFPETYHFPKKMRAKEIIHTMVSTFRKQYTPEMEARAKAISMTQNEVVTLASIIEKETSAEYERTLISAVFHNRLRRHIPLQSDPTVIYAIPGFDGNLKRKDLMVRSPYNTYRVQGLPPGPIASPGKASLIAALNPEQAKYYYFVSKNDGTHYFSTTLSEHNKAVDQYQRKRRKTRRSGS